MSYPVGFVESSAGLPVWLLGDMTTRRSGDLTILGRGLGKRQRVQTRRRRVSQGKSKVKGRNPKVEPFNFSTFNFSTPLAGQRTRLRIFALVETSPKLMRGSNEPQMISEIRGSRYAGYSAWRVFFHVYHWAFGDASTKTWSLGTPLYFSAPMVAARVKGARRRRDERR